MNLRKRFFLRLILAVLILLNAAVIFGFSSQNGTASSETSRKVSQTVAEIVVRDFDRKNESEQRQIVKKIDFPVRKIAHMTEFGTLGFLIFAFLLTFSGGAMAKFILSLLITGIYASADEWHQSLVEARGPGLTDVLIDLCGALILCSLLALFRRIWLRRVRLVHLRTTVYRLPASALRNPTPLRAVVVSDLHGADPRPVLKKIRAESPDLILLPGDVMDDRQLRNPGAREYRFLSECAAVAPTYYSLGNHELACYHKGNPWRHPKPLPLTDEIRRRIAATGVILLENDFVTVGRISICGLNSGIDGKKNRPDEAVLQRFAKAPGFRILLCHHPEYYAPYIKKTGIELTVSGHAHGGQWRPFGIAIYAPGQGLFPRFTSGTVDGRCVISRGVGNHTAVPRLWNPPEVLSLLLGTPTQK